jgi:hypothetical protein
MSNGATAPMPATSNIRRREIVVFAPLMKFTPQLLLFSAGQWRRGQAGLF